MRHSRDVSDIAAEAAEFANTQDALGQSAAQSEKSAAQLERGERYSTAAPLPLDPPPDGGVTAWMTVAGAFLTVFVQFGLTNSFGVFQGYYEEHYLSSYSSSEIAWIGGIQQFLLFFSGLPVGRLFDAHGAAVLLWPGVAIITLSLMLTSLCTQYYQFALTQGVLFGLGSGLVFYPSIAIPGQWFVKRRALAMGIVGSSSGLGGTLWPIAIDRLIKQIGFPWANRALGFISLLLMGVGTLMIRTRLPRKRATAWKSSFTHITEGPYILLTLCVCFIFWGLYTPFFYVSTNAIRLGASSSLAFYCVCFINAGSTIGRLVASVGDHWGPFNVLIVSAAGTAISLLAFWIPLGTISALIGFSVVYGFFVGGYISIVPACIAHTGPPSEIGIRMGLLWTIVATFALTGPPISGALLSHGGGTASARGYQYAGAFSGAVCLVGAVFAVASKKALSGRAWGVA